MCMNLKSIYMSYHLGLGVAQGISGMKLLLHESDRVLKSAIATDTGSIGVQTLGAQDPKYKGPRLAF